MAWTAKQLEALEAAIAEGALIVQYSDKKIEYRSLEQMQSIRDMMRKDLGLVPKTARLHASFSKGL